MLKPAVASVILCLLASCVVETEAPEAGLEEEVPSDEEVSSTSAVLKTARRGHYISFGTYRNLKTQMADVLASPASYTASARYEAERIKAAITAPGVRGVWIPFDWDLVEIGDGKFNWKPLEDNLAVASSLGLRVIFKFSDRSFNGDNIMPDYFPAEYSIQVAGRTTALGGYTSKRWVPYVYNRIIRIVKTIAVRYDAHPAFEGLATTESAIGQFDYAAHGYDKDAYVQALITIVNTTKPYFTQSKLFFYVNHIAQGVSLDLSKDARTQIITAVRGSSVVIGGPDVMADMEGHADSANLVYIWAERTYPYLLKSCHAQFDDYSQLKSNTFRLSYKTRTGSYPDDILRSASGVDVNLHPEAELGAYWTPAETFRYGVENFGCNYFFWHHKTWGGNQDRFGHDEYRTEDALPVIAANPTL